MSVALEADFKIFSVLLIKSWIRTTDYAFLNYSELFMANASYIFEKSWIENLNWRPHYVITLGVKDSGWNVSCKIAKLDISMSSQKFFKPCARLYNYYAITTTVIFILHITQTRRHGNKTHTLQFYNKNIMGVYTIYTT